MDWIRTTVLQFRIRTLCSRKILFANYMLIFLFCNDLHISYLGRQRRMLMQVSDSNRQIGIVLVTTKKWLTRRQLRLHCKLQKIIDLSRPFAFFNSSKNVK